MAKQKSLKKTIKNNKKKKLNLKNIDFKKNWKKLTFSGALALLLFTSVGFGGYTYLEQKNLEAKAAGWGLSLIDEYGGARILGCKKSEWSAYGPIWRVTLYVYNRSAGTLNASQRIVRRPANTVVNRVNVSLGPKSQRPYYGLVASQVYDDQLIVKGFGAERSFPVGALSTC